MTDPIRVNVYLDPEEIAYARELAREATMHGPFVGAGVVIRAAVRRMQRQDPSWAEVREDVRRRPVRRIAAPAADLSD